MFMIYKMLLDKSLGRSPLSSSILLICSVVVSYIISIDDHRFILVLRCLVTISPLISPQELGNSAGLHFNSSSSMTIDVQLGEMGHGLLGSSHLSTINQSELTMGLGGETLEQPLSATPSPAGSLVDEDMDDFKVRGFTCRLSENSLLHALMGVLMHLTIKTLCSISRRGACWSTRPCLCPLPSLNCLPTSFQCRRGVRPL